MNIKNKRINSQFLSAETQFVDTLFKLGFTYFGI